MSKHDIDKAYISPYDKFLYQFDKTHELSASQLVEIIKNEAIAKLRDNVQPQSADNGIWTEF